MLPAQPIQPAHIPQLNWSHFKPEFTGKPHEDVEAHLLRLNALMDTHAFQEGFKVQQFCLTLVGEARLWYKSLRPINVDWNGLQKQFRQQYSKIGNTREQLFHVWRSFHFDKNTNIRFLCYMHKTGNHIIRLWRYTGVGSFPKYTPCKIILSTLSYRRFQTSS